MKFYNRQRKINKLKNQQASWEILSSIWWVARVGHYRIKSEEHAATASEYQPKWRKKGIVIIVKHATRS